MTSHIGVAGKNGEISKTLCCQEETAFSLCGVFPAYTLTFTERGNYMTNVFLHSSIFRAAWIEGKTVRTAVH